MNQKLKKWQILYIDDKKYMVTNMIEYKEDTWIWQEYEIRNELGSSKWLCLEKREDGKEEYSIYTPYYETINKDDLLISANGKEYELYEKGTAIVKDYFGDADVDIGEECQYIDYMTNDNKYMISVETWETEQEKSQGEFIDSTRIRITDEIDERKKEEEKKKKKSNIIMIWVIMGIFLAPIFFSMIISWISGLFVNKSMEKYIEKNNHYTYVTSITNNTNQEKAKVYKASFSTIDQTVKDMIDGVPEGITNIIDTDSNTEEDGIGLHTKNEFAYIYLENGEVYVQVSDKNYVKNSSGSTYHNRHHHYYYHTYNSTRISPTYSIYRNSARQQSVNSRTSSGGGTSSGK